MRGIWLVARRELYTYLNSMWGYIVVAVILVINGLLFNAFAMSDRARLSFEVLRDFFYFSFGTTVIASILLTMRLIAEEKQTNTIVLLDSSPITDWQVVLGKYLSSMAVLGTLIVSTAYMPALIFVNGKVSVGHIFAGYLGLLMVGSATVAIGTFASTLSKSQLVSAVIGGVITVFLLVSWLLAKLTDPPLNAILSYLSLFDRHFRTTFMEGRIESADLVFFGSVTFVFLMLATRVFESRRWA
ncbi:ABC transporter permease subunit [Microvenator marinus]|uniref:ABC transporter permease subunit n=1 Tax=Microvenator marinus TaxID=2600177 RepID=A0A5B8XN72_9DELT|nr:ABC transporter permease [Microvenator marinus]QED26985.1 ABC transporter permease subunit [Microvenator marinus]